MRLLRASGALVVLAVALLGIPLFLLQVGNPGYLLEADWGNVLLRAGDSRTILALLSVIGWIAWAVLALTIVTETIAVLSRHRITITLPGLGWLRPGIGALVMTAIALPSVATADDAAMPQPAPVASATTTRAATSPVVDRAVQTPPSHSYVVQAGDELWTVAEQQLGAGDRWREIVALNAGLHADSRLSPGQVLRLPDPPPPATSESVVVEKGDSLWALADEHLDDPLRWPEIHELNRDQITDPDQIDVGWELKLPETAAEVPGDDTGSAAEVPGDDTAAVEELSPPDDAPSTDDVSEVGGVPATPSYIVTPPPQPGLTDERIPSAEQQTASVAPETFDAKALLGPISAALAAAVVGGIVIRRRSQLFARPLGHRMAPIAAELARFWGALGQRASAFPGGAEDATGAVEPRHSSATIQLGWRADQSPVTLDLEAAGLTLITGDDAHGALGAAIVGLALANPTTLVIAGDSPWSEALNEPTVVAEPGTAAGIAALQRLCAERRLALGSATLAHLRANPDTAEAMEPVVFVFTDPLNRTDISLITDALDIGHTGVSILGTAVSPNSAAATIVEITADHARLGAETFEPQLITEPAKHAVVGLLEATTVAALPAPWWQPAPPTAPLKEHLMTTRISSRAHPTLLLLGDVELAGAAGTAPTRAVSQCLEYCAWLLANPNSRPTAMMRELLVADTTRRSNMSRLRTWLGDAPDGARYLPDAYSGRISLDPRITSDWEQFQATLGGGVPGASTSALKEALSMVRGQPLGALAFQWAWAENLRADMVAMIVDAACVLADRHLEQGDTDGALWAIRQGWLAAPDDDHLAVRRIDVLAALGSSEELDAAVLSLTRALRADSRDLPAELAARVQAATQAPRRAAV